MDLNAAQLEAVTTLSGPLLVLAGAGSGKTRVVTYRIARLIGHGVRPERILAVTFTNKAAAEMQERVAALLGKRKKEKPEVSTFHSLCVRILRRNIHHLGYPAQFAIYDRGDQESVARAALREIRVGDGLLRPGDLLALIGRWKSAVGPPGPGGRAAAADRQGTSGRRRLPPLPEDAQGPRRRRFRRPAAADRGAFLPLSPGPPGGGPAVRPPAGRRVPGHQRQPVPHRQGPGRRAPQPLRGGRRRPVDLRLARRRGDRTSSASATTGPRPRSSGWRSTTARPGRSSPGPTG